MTNNFLHLKNKLIGSFFLLVILSFLFSEINAQSHPFSGGNGSANSPYQIETRAQLDSIRNRLGTAYSNVHYKIMNDIDLSSESWIPIGHFISFSDQSKAFCGKLHGNNKNITGMNIGQEAIPLTYQYSGLFGYIHDGAYIDSLHITGGKITSWTETSYPSYTGGIAGFSFCYSTILNITIIECSSSVEILVSEGLTPYAGGITGYCYGINNNIKNCINSGDITCNSEYAKIGGIIGERYTSNPSGYSIQNCENYGNIIQNVDNSTVGGIVGSCLDVNIENCKNNGNILGSAANLFVGGIIGEGNSLILSNNTNSGLINGNGNNTFIGGIIGKANSIQIINNNNSGDISVSGISICVGGITGDGYTVNFNNCNNYGNLTGIKAALGGIISIGNSSIIINDCTNYGIIRGSGKSIYLGGIAGIINSNITNETSIEKTINFGDIYGGPEDSVYAGGILSKGIIKFILKIVIIIRIFI